MGRNILVVEDDRNISELIHMYLVKEGFDVRLAGDGARAIEEFERQIPDLILDEEERTDFDDILRDLDAIVCAALEVKFAERTKKERPGAATPRRPVFGPMGINSNDRKISIPSSPGNGKQYFSQGGGASL